MFDHTSLIQFIEQRFACEHRGLIETNITKWRRAVAGDLTSAFNFRSPNAAVVTLPPTDTYAPPDHERHPDYEPAVPAMQAMPKQERGVRPARPLPYELQAHGKADFGAGTLEVRFVNAGKAAAVYHVRSGNSQLGPWTYTVGAGDKIDETWAIRGNGLSAYDLSVYGPNGFFRSFKGSIRGKDKANLTVRAGYQDCGITLDIHNRSDDRRKVRIYEAYSRQSITLPVGPGRSLVWHWSLDKSFGWYDLTVEVEHDPSFRRQLAGHVETGRDSVSDPAFGA